MVMYAHTRPGYKFQLTYTGRKVKAIADKYRDGSIVYKQYQHCVPRTWITNGYVEEVKENTDGN